MFPYQIFDLQGFERKPYLEPAIRCADNFKVDIFEESVRLERIFDGKFFNESDFCVVVNEELQKIYKKLLKNIPNGKLEKLILHNV